MIHYQFSIYDAKAQAYLPPFILPKIEMAKRTFADCINSNDHQFGAHPEDYTLFTLGTFDDETAKFSPEANGPQVIGNGVIFKIEPISGKENGKAQTADSSVEQVSNDAPVLPGTAGSDSKE